MGEIDDRIAALPDPVNWDEADEGDMVAGFLAHVIGGRYAATGEFMLTLSIPSEILDPHKLMQSQGMLTWWEGFRA
jgi:hypothetical protein